MHQSFPCKYFHLLIAFRINGEIKKFEEVSMHCAYTSIIHIFSLSLEIIGYFHIHLILNICFLSHREAVMKAPIDSEFYKLYFLFLLCYDLRHLWDMQRALPWPIIQMSSQIFFHFQYLSPRS